MPPYWKSKDSDEEVWVSKARKKHICRRCGGEIQKGAEYVRYRKGLKIWLTTVELHYHIDCWNVLYGLEKTKVVGKA